MNKTVDMLNNKTGKAVHRFAVHGKYKLIGSNQQRGMLFASDVDVAVHLNGRAETLARYFQNAFKGGFKETYFMDFKAGLNHRLVYRGSLIAYLKNPLIPDDTKSSIRKARGEAREKLIRSLYVLRWTPADVAKGFVKMVDGTKKTLAEAIEDDTIIKVDVIVPVGDTYAEVSENYVYKQTPETVEDAMKGMEDDIEYYRHKNTMKALKRVYRVLLLDPKGHEKKLKSLFDLFNSSVGFANKIKNDLELLVLLRSKHPKAPVEPALQVFKEKMASIDWIEKEKVMVTWEKVPATIEYLQRKINLFCKDYIRLIM
jgi:hypothetical protein